MRSNAAKKQTVAHESKAQPQPARKLSVKLVEKYETSQYDELVSVDYEAFLLQYGSRSDFA